MTETYLWSITNSGTWMLILVPTYSMKIFIGQTVMTTYVVPFVIGMLLARDLIVGIFIPSSISLPASICRHSRYGGTQTRLPTAHGAAPPAARYGPVATSTAQDPREGPSLARRVTTRSP